MCVIPKILLLTQESEGIVPNDSLLVPNYVNAFYQVEIFLS